MLRNNLMLPTEALDIPEAIDFDGTNDYLSRSSDLVGNADGKTFTFSAWVWANKLTTSGYTPYLYNANNGTSNRVNFFFDASDQLTIFGANSSGTAILVAQVTIPKAARDTYVHVLVSVDLANSANRAVYINDTAATVTWSTYTNASINFTVTEHNVACDNDAGNKLKGRLSHLFLAYEYIDLSIESNRRIFITADRKPA